MLVYERVRFAPPPKKKGFNKAMGCRAGWSNPRARPVVNQPNPWLGPNEHVIGSWYVCLWVSEFWFGESTICGLCLEYEPVHKFPAWLEIYQIWSEKQEGWLNHVILLNKAYIGSYRLPSLGGKWWGPLSAPMQCPWPTSGSMSIFWAAPTPASHPNSYGQWLAKQNHPSPSVIGYWMIKYDESLRTYQ